MSDTRIIVVGYPKSGNTWLSRLLGDCLNSPVGGLPSRHPLATEGTERSGKYQIIQEHLLVEQDVPGKIVFLLRDPRDVCVSICYYWQFKSMSRAIEVVGNGTKPLDRHGSWVNYNRGWMRDRRPVAVVKYEKLLEDTTNVLWKLCDDLEVDIVDLKGAIERQSFATKRADILKNGNDLPWGRTVQLRNLRKGIAGDWRNEFTERNIRQADSYFAKALQEYGYT